MQQAREISGSSNNDRKQKNIDRVSRFFKLIYLKLFRINDTPNRIAIGFGLGVFLGSMPGAGPLAAVFFALLLRVNRASALAGALLTNTWLSIAFFLLSIRIGSRISGLSYNDLCNQWSIFLKDFHWINLFQFSAYKIILPVVAGYVVISLFLGILSYALAYVFIITRQRRKAHI